MSVKLKFGFTVGTLSQTPPALLKKSGAKN